MSSSVQSAGGGSVATLAGDGEPKVRPGDIVLAGQAVPVDEDPAGAVARPALVIERQLSRSGRDGLLLAVFLPGRIFTCGPLPYSPTLKRDHWSPRPES